MTDYGLSSLLPRGTKTWQNDQHETTIDLTLASDELASTLIKCAIHSTEVTEHGSDHGAIESSFDITLPDHVAEPRLLFKSAPWKAINERIGVSLRLTPIGGSVQQQTDWLLTAVTEAIEALTPKAKPSPYAKRWWTTDLTQLRQVYTYWRKEARAQRRRGTIVPELEQQARNASKEFHDAIRKQKSSHWEEFLADNTNIWKAAKYLKPDNNTFDKIPQLTIANGSNTGNTSEQAEELLKTFFRHCQTQYRMKTYDLNGRHWQCRA